MKKYIAALDMKFMWPFYLMFAVFITVISFMAWHHHKYKCIKWHKEWFPETSHGKSTDYAHWEYICDEEVLRNGTPGNDAPEIKCPCDDNR